MIPKKTEYIGVRIDAKLKDRIEKLAIKERRPISNMVCILVEKALEKE